MSSIDKYFPVDKIDFNWPEAITLIVLVICILVFLAYCIKIVSED